MAMEIISKDKKEIQWKGLPRTSINDIEDLQVFRLLFPLVIDIWCTFGSHIYLFIYALLQTELVGLKSRIEKKNTYLQELQDQVMI